MDKQFRIADKARSSLQELTNDFQRALTANGFLRGRGIRMRLLHQHICAITGDSRCARQMQTGLHCHCCLSTPIQSGQAD